MKHITFANAKEVERSFDTNPLADYSVIINESTFKITKIEQFYIYLRDVSNNTSIYWPRKQLTDLVSFGVKIQVSLPEILDHEVFSTWKVTDDKSEAFKGPFSIRSDGELFYGFEIRLGQVSEKEIPELASSLNKVIGLLKL